MGCHQSDICAACTQKNANYLMQCSWERDFPSVTKHLKQDAGFLTWLSQTTYKKVGVKITTKSKQKALHDLDLKGSTPTGSLLEYALLQPLYSSEQSFLKIP